MKSKKDTAKKVKKAPAKTTKVKAVKPKKAVTKKQPAKKTVKSSSSDVAKKPAIKAKASKIKTKEPKAKMKPKTPAAKPKKFFPAGAVAKILPTGAVPPKAAASKRTPWMKKPVENPHSTPAGPCVNLKDLFDNYIDKKYKRMKDEQRSALWKAVGLQMVLNSEPFSRVGDIIEEHLSKK